ncbi:hypothetical protein N473_06840 [Pseudoalteromonas luteoviolacea CPMOR-1]|uniref:Uncharacterized protein n=1 Tax=Pseudoalteromonas luteoviolacea CPMOR-1 TaxID=1365248 RepID=A0A167H3L6_9GAMM|nr:hypothetical protein N473_06840 [Pseudoalteromonas luteoviolacea CPMOR-1]
MAISTTLNYKLLYVPCLLGSIAYFLVTEGWLEALIGAPIFAAFLTFVLMLVLFAIAMIATFCQAVLLILRAMIAPLLPTSPTTRQSRLP